MATLVEEQAHLKGRQVRLLVPFIRPYRKRAYGALALLLVATLLQLAGPVFLQRAIDRGIRGHDLHTLNLYGALFVGASAIAFLAFRYSILLMGWVGQQALRDLRTTAFRHLMDLSLAFFERERSGRLVARVTSDAEAVERLVTEDLIRLFSEMLFVLGAGILLFILDPKLALVALAVTPVMFIATVIFRRHAQRVYADLRERVSSVLSFMQETLRGVHVVQAFSRESVSHRHFREVNDEWGEAKVGTFFLDANYFSVIEFLTGVATAGVLLAGGSRVLGHTLTLGTLTAFTVYLSQFFEPIHHLSERYSTFQSAMAGLARIAKLLETESSIQDAPDAITMNEMTGAIRMQDVGFRYSSSGPTVLSDVNLEIKPGETVALVGPTGAGKSTIVKLLARFYDATDGRLQLDGVDISQIANSSLRGKVALVPQEGFLFSGTIAENIRFGDPDATDEEVMRLCEDLGIADFIRTLPQGLDTEVKERGARLASGERQLIGLARALAADPTVVLLDEATSSLDSRTETRVDAAFKKALQGRTSVVIAHRLSTVMNSDRIVVVEGGRIIESGTHAELVDAGGRYAALFRSWLGATA